MRAAWLGVALAWGCTTEEPSLEAPASCGTLGLVAPDLSAPAGVRQTSTGWTVPWTGATREIPLTVWYPTDATSGEAAEWLSFFPDAASWVDAPLRAPSPGCTYPVAVYSHGYQGYGGVAAEVARHLTRLGWVVVAPDHTGNTLVDDGPHDPTYDLVRAGDLSAALDALDALPSSDPLAGRLDTTRVLAIGHSYGGQSAWLVGGARPQADAVAARCEGGACGPDGARALADGGKDARVVAIAPMAGTADGLVGAGGYAEVTAPVRQYTGSADFRADAQWALAQTEGVDMTWLHVEGACHNSFITSPFGCETLAHDAGMTWLVQDVGAFATAAVLGSTDPDVGAILQGQAPTDVTVERHTPDRP
ncbi:MAG: hypothetical protein RLZZ383_290 [Pseudomonadota bacterium]|jgi:predicted dienelactone hydrolase